MSVCDECGQDDERKASQYVLDLEAKLDGTIRDLNFCRGEIQRLRNLISAAGLIEQLAPKSK